MPTKITDPTLHAALEAKWETEDRQGWVIYGGYHYKVGFSTTGVVFFLQYTNEELFDSRSPTDSKTASYKELDED